MDTLKHCKPSLIVFCCLLLLSCYLVCVADETNISSHNRTMCIEHERQALLKFKQGIRVDFCGLLSSWGDHEDSRNCCKWHGVQCSNITGHVIMLNLRGVETYSPDEMCLQGKVGTSLGELKQLRHLDLSFNDFGDQPIPRNIASLVHLRYLNLSNSFSQGEIPPQLGNLSNLVSLDLNSIDLDAGLYVKSLSWVSHLSMLRSISLSGVNLSEAINWQQVMNNLPLLKVLELQGCSLPPLAARPLSYKNSSTTLSFLNLGHNDLISSSLYGWLFNLSGINTHLTHLDLSANQLAGPIPSDFGNMQALSYLSLSVNHFEGQIPDTISNIKPLTHLHLAFNNLQSLPKTLGSLCSLQELDLSSNNFTDELSYIIQSLSGCASKSLLSLYLSDSKIQGHISELIGNFSSMRELYLDYNKLNGRIPESLGQLSKMEILYLSYNRLEGILSNIHFSNLLGLRELSLANNSGLALDINNDIDWVTPFQLDFIDLSSCKVGPLFPKWLLSQKNYSYLDMSNAGIFDSIPHNFWNSISSKLVILNLSHNNLYGTVPNLSSLQLNGLDYYTIEVDLSFNNLEGAIPSFPSNINALLLKNNKFTNPIPFMCPKSKIQLSNLDLSNNLLSGELSDCCWMNFPRLSILHIENNNFSGVIPSSIGYLEELQALHLRNNIISGGLPRSFLHLKSLVILDLGQNLLSGHIPPSIGNSLRNVAILNLQGNNFDGNLPLSLCQMSLLQVLDLSSNHIFGTIPKCIYNFTAMQNGTDFMPTLEYLVDKGSLGYIDAATILWKRKEWSFGNTLGLVKAIDISNNELEGEIPTKISFLKGLDSLNLSRNNLIGAIPPELGRLTALQTLDLSNNKISGEVPTSFAELNSLGILDLSNNHLTGKIPDIPQLQRFDETAYIGNSGLCGQPLPKCPWDEPHDNNPTKEDDANNQDVDDSDDIFTVELYTSVTLGFIIGFWGVCGTLVLKRS